MPRARILHTSSSARCGPRAATPAARPAPEGVRLGRGATPPSRRPCRGYRGHQRGIVGRMPTLRRCACCVARVCSAEGLGGVHIYECALDINFKTPLCMMSGTPLQRERVDLRVGHARRAWHRCRPCPRTGRGDREEEPATGSLSRVEAVVAGRSRSSARTHRHCILFYTQTLYSILEARAAPRAICVLKPEWIALYKCVRADRARAQC